MVLQTLMRCGALLVLGLLPAPSARALVSVHFGPGHSDVNIGQTFDVDVVADADTLLLGFGIDVAWDETILALVGTPAIDPVWTAVFAPDGDGLAGLAPAAGLTGSGLVLATLTFQALEAGTTALTASVTPGDLTEGFSLKAGGFDAVQFQAGSVTVPEPAGWLLLLAVLASFGVRRRPRVGAAALALSLVVGGAPNARAQVQLHEPSPESNDLPWLGTVVLPPATTFVGELNDLYQTSDQSQGALLSAGQVNTHTFNVSGPYFTAWIQGGSPFTPLDTIVGHFDASGNPLGVNDDGGPYRLVESALSAEVPLDGVVRLKVTGWPDNGFSGNHSESGSYFLHLNERRQDIDFVLFTGLTPGKPFEAEIVSASFDSLLGLYNPVLDHIVGFDDDGGAGTLSKLSGVVPATGELTFGVSAWPDFDFDGLSYEGIVFGPYVLDLRVQEDPVLDGSCLGNEPATIKALPNVLSLDPFAPQPPTIFDVSHDGKAILGQSEGEYVLWSIDNGFDQGTVLPLSDRPVDVASDGKAVSGDATLVSGYVAPFRYLPDTGTFEVYGQLEPDKDSYRRDLAGDGTTLVGESDTRSVPSSLCPSEIDVLKPVFRSPGAGVFESLDCRGMTPFAGPALADFANRDGAATPYEIRGSDVSDGYCKVTAVSPDGSAVLGTTGQGLTVDYHLPRICSISGTPCDSSADCGGGSDFCRGERNGCGDVAAYEEVVIWDANGTATAIGPAPRPPLDANDFRWGEIIPLGMSADAKMVAAYEPNVGHRVWTEDQGWGPPLSDIPWDPTASSNRVLRAVAPDGSFALGMVLIGSPVRLDVFMWDEENGLRLLKDVLEQEEGLDLRNWELQDVIGVGQSDAGTVIVGKGEASGKAAVWVVRIPPRDRDRDGLLDHWEEREGIDVDGDGIISPCTSASCPDLQLVGADPDHMDIFVEVDVFEDVTDLTDLEAAIADVTHVFSIVPNEKIGNPDGAPGINLHMQIDKAQWQVGVTIFDENGNDTGSTQWNADWMGDCDDDDPPSTPPEYVPTWLEYHGTPDEGDEVLRARTSIYRHLFFGGQSRCGLRGVASKPGPVARVMSNSPGIWSMPAGVQARIDTIAGSIMHELGHTLGLDHNGATGDNHAPNYHSVMNYTWAVPWVQSEPGPWSAAQRLYDSSWILDYSRMPFRVLHEDALDEARGIGGHPWHFTQVGPLDTSGPNQGKPRVENEFFALDWNRNGIPGQRAVGPVDVNYTEPDSQSPGSVLVAQDDWTFISQKLCTTYSSPGFAVLQDALPVLDSLMVVFENTDLGKTTWIDCNHNGVLDDTDLANGVDTDSDGNGLLDGCEPLWGDLDRDDDIDDADRDLLVASFGRSEGESLYRPLADLDFDRTITHLDYQLWVDAYDAFQASLLPTTTGSGGSGGGGGDDRPICGLLGLEPLALLWLLRRRRTARVGPARK